MADFFVFTGNCQGQYLAAVFDGFNGARAVFFGHGFGFVPNFGPKLARNLVGDRFYQTVNEARARGDRIIVAQQVTSVVFPAQLGFEPDFVCSFPGVALYALSPPEFCAFYGMDEAPALDRILAIDIGTMMQSQRKSAFPVDVVGYIEQNFRRENLFNTSNHPTGVIGALLTDGILRQLESFDPAYADTGLVETVRSNEGVNFMTSLPLTPEVVEGLQLDWGARDQLLVRILDFGKAGDLASDAAAALIAAHRETFGDNTQFWEVASRVYLARGEAGLRIDALKRMVELSPGWLFFWIDLSNALLEVGDREGFERLPSQVTDFYGERMDGDYVLSALHLSAGRYQEGLEAGLSYFEATRHWHYALTYIAPALIHLGRADEVAAYAEMSRRAFPDNAGDVDKTLAVYAHHLPTPVAPELAAV